MLIDILNLWKPALEICILWFIVYQILLFFKGTRAVQVVRGIIILIVAFFVFQILGLHTMNWLLTKFFAISVIGILIIFQPELRYGLARLGRQHLFNAGLKEEEMEVVLTDVAEAADFLAHRKVGTLIAIQRESKLNSYIETGELIDSRVSKDLLSSIFMSSGPLHDGGLIIHLDRIVAAGCLFPLSEKPDLSRTLGTRHRAAVGLSEDTDAAIVIVSEETGDISLAFDGKLKQGLSHEELLENLKHLFRKKQ